ncbi:MAG: VOC family protein [Spirochaetaceae bacterium]|jgi:PhnB protein|nr:VOC family protein [Spirochaetaceae bacterium]
MLGHYLIFNRNCAEALETYAKAFGANVGEVQKYGDMPPDPSFPIAEADKSLVLHSRLNIAGAELMCADASERSTSGSNMYVTVTTPDAALVKGAWDILKVGAEIYMELAPTFFASLHGSLRDKFGINWMFTASQ